MAQHHFLAFDLGAESGRGILGTLTESGLGISEVHRFPNLPAILPDGLHWDVLYLWQEIRNVISSTVRRHGVELKGIGLDTWGVDFALLDRQGALVSNPYHYRDRRTEGMMQEAFRRLSREKIFDLTGIQFLQLNTLIQLLSMVIQQSPALDVAAHLVMLPDLFNYWLTGRIACEFTAATTSQCYDPRRRNWSDTLLDCMGIPRRLFPEIVQPGTVLGPLLGPIADETGARKVKVIAPACHDTGSAVAAVPASQPGFAWISSGTWSIMGAELGEPIINAKSLAYNFTNEGGVGGTFRFSKNIAALWLVQESRRTWANEGQALSYDELTALAAKAKPLQSIVNTNAPDFFEPGDIPARIREYCSRTGQPVPEGKGEIIRCALESLACQYRWVLERMEEILGRKLEPIHIVGGGTKNRLLSQLTADCTGRTVIAGPVEATAIGNLLVQAIAVGDIASLSQAREIVRQSFPVEVFEPKDREGWDAAYAQSCALQS